MSSAALTLVSNLPSVAAIVGAVLLALDGHGTWGWFLFAGVVLAAGPVLAHTRVPEDASHRSDARA